MAVDLNNSQLRLFSKVLLFSKVSFCKVLLIVIEVIDACLNRFLP